MKDEVFKINATINGIYKTYTIIILDDQLGYLDSKIRWRKLANKDCWSKIVVPNGRIWLTWSEL